MDTCQRGPNNNGGPCGLPLKQNERMLGNDPRQQSPDTTGSPARTLRAAPLPSQNPQHFSVLGGEEHSACQCLSGSAFHKHKRILRFTFGCTQHLLLRSRDYPTLVRGAGLGWIELFLVNGWACVGERWLSGKRLGLPRGQHINLLWDTAHASLNMRPCNR